MSFFNFLNNEDPFEEEINSSEIIAGFSADIDFLKSSVMEAGEAIIEYVSTLKAQRKSASSSDFPVVVQTVMRGMGINDIDGLGWRLKTIGREFGNKRNHIMEGLLDNFPDDVDYETVTVQELGSVSFISAVNFIADFSGDLAMLVLKTLSDKENGVKTKSQIFVSAKLRDMNRVARQYGAIAEMFISELDAVINDITLLPTIPVYRRDASESYLLEEESRRSTKKAKSGYLTAGFNNNPFYHLRLIFTDWSISKNEKRKETKRLLESRIVELKAAENGATNPKLSKQVEYYEKKVAKLDYKIKHFEEEANE